VAAARPAVLAARSATGSSTRGTRPTPGTPATSDERLDLRDGLFDHRPGLGGGGGYMTAEVLIVQPLDVWYRAWHRDGTIGLYGDEPTAEPRC
jgi:hypothetical protein